jgi:hypothetical protein
MQAEIYVQGQLYKVMEAEFTHQLLNQVTNDIQNGLVPHFDPELPHSIEIKNLPAPETPAEG